uniref:Uncharacterized protein n=1 Tax=Micrurus lemniscatus lemniscatus TaxID=129467 RepID=A0A2D4IDJ7_MICLE
MVKLWFCKGLSRFWERSSPAFSLPNESGQISGTGSGAAREGSRPYAATPGVPSLPGSLILGSPHFVCLSSSRMEKGMTESHLAIKTFLKYCFKRKTKRVRSRFSFKC